jgi:predicted DNA-binding protein
MSSQMPARNPTVTGYGVPAIYKQRLEQYAQAQGRSESFYVTKLVIKLLNELDKEGLIEKIPEDEYVSTENTIR